MSKDENPSAFPRTHGEHGMTLRDWFAGQALPAALERGFMVTTSVGRNNSPVEWAVRLSYRVADAMLAERAKP